MKTIQKLILLGTLICGAGSVAQAEVARHRFSCDSVPTNGAEGYKSERFSGFIYPDTHQINLTYSLVDAEGKDIASGEFKTSYANAGGQIQVAIARPDGVSSKLAISTDMFSLAPLAVVGDFDGSKLSCQLNLTQLLSPAETPKSAFEKYNLPVTMDGLLPVKVWTSSDGTFQFEASLVEDFVNRHGRRVKGFSSLKVSFLGMVVDNEQDVPRFAGYILSGPEKRTVRATLTNPADVQKIISIFGGPQVLLKMVHPYGAIQPVDLQIDCTSGTACVITAQN